MSEPKKSFADLLALMHRLRSPGGCPWDAEQTHQTLRPYLIEECYEVLEALDSGADDELSDELGDLLLQVVFHAELATERGAFDIADIITGLHDKLVRRHPHVFGDVDVTDSAEVKRNWASIKAIEREEKAQRRADRGEEVSKPVSALDGVPNALPSLLRAQRLGQKAASVGLDWKSAADVRRKIDEELAEVSAAVASGDSQAIADELGDLLFAATSYARHLGASAEISLRTTLDRFEERVHLVEAEIRERDTDASQLDDQQLDEMWQRAKSRTGRAPQSEN
jgi:MazG family protein